MADYTGTTGDDIYEGSSDADTAHGNAGNDTLRGNGGNDTLYGDAGNDTLIGGTGLDILYGGDDDDTFKAVAGDLVNGEEYHGGNGNDFFQIDTGAAVVDVTGIVIDGIETMQVGAFTVSGPDGLVFEITPGQLSGIDNLSIGGGALSVIGGGMVDLSGAHLQLSQIQLSDQATTLNLENATISTIFIYSYINGGAAGDTIIGSNYRDFIYGMGGDDVLAGGHSGNDLLDGGEGNDRLIYDSSYNFRTNFTGGDGIDTLDCSVGNFSGVTVTLGYDTGDVGQALVASAPDNANSVYTIENIIGSGLDDALTGSKVANVIDGGGGVDRILGLDGDDILAGGAGGDAIYGGDGNDILYSGSISGAWDRGYYGITPVPPTLDTGAEQDILVGGDGDDVLYAGYGDTVDGGAGSDLLLISFMGATSGVTADFTNLYNNGTMTVGGRDITGIEGVSWIQGSDFADTITAGGSYGNFAPIFAMGGDDHLTLGYYTGIVHGGEGNDTIDASGAEYGLPVYGDEGDDVITGLADLDIAYGGSGNDTITGSGSFYGEDGNDILTAVSSPYATMFSGGDGDDQLTAANGAVTFNGGNDNDVLTGSGMTDTLNGDAGTDTIYGNGGDDAIDGGTGADAMYGGAGDDSYIVDNAGDTVIEAVGGGLDTVSASASWSMGAGQEIEQLRTTNAAGLGAIDLTGNDLANTIIGNDGANVLTGGGGSDALTGNGGNDTLDGGTGTDTMTGGMGDDIYIVDTIGDQVIELADQGTDTISTSLSWTIAGQEIENLNTSNAAGIDAINLTGNEFANIITGNDGANRLVGGGGDDTIFGGGGADRIEGGTGADAMTGGTGDDSYVVDDAGDTVFEAGGQGTDRVATTVSWAMAAGQEIEQLTVANMASTNAVNLTGNEFANKLAGNDGANTLIGGGGNDKLAGAGGNDILDGGTGADQMQGGTGSDSYIVDNAGDTVVEANSGGVDYDTVMATVSWSLGAGQEVERLRAAPGTDPINLTGNELAQKIQGNDGANVLLGGGGNDVIVAAGGDDTLKGGTGLDKLTGGLGADTFVFEHGGQMDQIVDFTVGTDKADLTAFGLTWQDVQAAMTESNGNTILTLGGGDSVVFAGVSEASLSASDFLLGGNTLSNTVQPDMGDGGSGDMLHAQIHTPPAMFEWHLL